MQQIKFKISQMHTSNNHRRRTFAPLSIGAVESIWSDAVAHVRHILTGRTVFKVIATAHGCVFKFFQNLTCDF